MAFVDNDRDPDDESDEDADRDLPLEQDMDKDPDATGVEPCPYCRKPITEDAEWCHHCGQYISREDAPHRVPLWLMVGAIVVGLVIATWVFVRF